MQSIRRKLYQLKPTNKVDFISSSSLNGTYHKDDRDAISRDRIVVSTLRCGRSNPGSNPGHGIFSREGHSGVCIVQPLIR